MKLRDYYPRYLRLVGSTDSKIIQQHGDTLGRKELGRINRNDMTSFQKSLSHYAPSSQSRICGAIRTAYRWACHEADISPKELPIRDGKVAEKDPLSSPELRALLSELEPDPRLLAKVMAETGARYCEARQITIASLDGDKLTVTLTHIKGTGLPESREVPISETLYLMLTERAQNERCALLRNGARGWLKDGNAFREALSEAAASAGIKRKVTPHLLRHTFGTMLGEREVGIEKIASLMGHSKLETCRQYVKVRNSKQRDAVIGMYD